MGAYVATTNTPGYLPTDDDPPMFGTAAEAWQSLVDGLGDDAWQPDDESDPDGPQSLTATALELEDMVRRAERGEDSEGTVYGPTPGYDGSHDLGIAYSVSWWDEDDDGAGRWPRRTDGES